MNQDTIHYLFPNLNKLLNFQRKFLIRLESTAELPWTEQRWGLIFVESVSPCAFLTLTLLNMGFPLLFRLHSHHYNCHDPRTYRKRNLLSTSPIAPITLMRLISC
jgi:hypothetical protein